MNPKNDNNPGGNKSRLNLSRENIPKNEPEEKQEPATPEEAQAQAMASLAQFYTDMGNCAMNLIPEINRIANALEDILVELNDLKTVNDKRALADEIITEEDIEARDSDDKDES